jgi:hypothetical protein
MKTEKIDSIVKEFLLSKELTLHYYVPNLLNALNCLRELSFDFNLGKNVKEVELIPNEFNRIAIPVDCVQVGLVFGLFGGETRAFRFNEKVSLVTNNVAYGDEETTIPDLKQNNGSMVIEYVSPYELPQQIYVGDNDKYCYNVDVARGEIVLGVEHELTKVYLRYESSYVDVSSTNLVHPYLIPVIKSYISYMFEKSNSSMNRIAEGKDAYYNEKRLLRARMNPLNISDYYKLLEE